MVFFFFFSSSLPPLDCVTHTYSREKPHRGCLLKIHAGNELYVGEEESLACNLFARRVFAFRKRGDFKRDRRENIWIHVGEGAQLSVLCVI